jgi:hypothetical protein
MELYSPPMAPSYQRVADGFATGGTSDSHVRQIP